MPAMHLAGECRRRLGVDLCDALGADEFFLVYQPTVGLRTGAVTGAEALLRWHHPARGVVMPADFVPALEASGLVVPVGAWVLEAACRQAAARHAAGHPMTVSARQLERDRIVADVRDAPDTSELALSHLVLDLTESSLVDNVDETISRLAELSELGVRIAVDDFETGYSSLAPLRRLPVDVLKFDRSFVACIGQSPDSVAMLHALVRLVKTFQLTTIAEGIEDQEQRRRVVAEGVDLGQGFSCVGPSTRWRSRSSRGAGRDGWSGSPVLRSGSCRRWYQCRSARRFAGAWLRWLERSLHTAEVGGSSPSAPTTSPYSNFGEGKSRSKGSL